MGALLGLPSGCFRRHPFPGPGLAVRIIGEVTPEKLKDLQAGEQHRGKTLVDAGGYTKAVAGLRLRGRRQGDRSARRREKVGYQVTVKIVESVDAMTADWSRRPYPP